MPVPSTLQSQLKNGFFEDEKEVAYQMNYNYSDSGVAELKFGLLAENEWRIAKDRVHG